MSDREFARTQKRAYFRRPWLRPGRYASPETAEEFARRHGLPL